MAQKGCAPCVRGLTLTLSEELFTLECLTRYNFIVTFYSMSLHLGNEIFDVHKMPLQGDVNHLFVRQGLGLQGQAVFKTKLTFR